MFSERASLKSLSKKHPQKMSDSALQSSNWDLKIYDLRKRPAAGNRYFLADGEWPADRIALAGFAELAALATLAALAALATLAALAAHPVGVERLHAGDDPIGGWSFTVAALR